MSAPPKPWTELTAAEKRDAIKPLILAGIGYPEIVKRTGAKNRNVIAGIVSRLRNAGEVPATPTREEVGAHGGAIVRIKADRRSEPAQVPAPARQKQPAVERRQRRVANPYQIKGGVAEREFDPGIEVSRSAAFEPLPDYAPVAFVLNIGCKWPVDGRHGPGLLVCGGDRGDHVNYCAAHRRLAFLPAKERAA